MTRYHTKAMPILDDEGNETGEFESVNIPFTSEEEAEWDARGLAAAEQELIAAPIRAREAAKAARTAAVAAIKVTTSAGNEFDGDEVSQGRMARAIIALQATGTPSVTWVLANNTPIEASAAELVEALALAGAAQAAIWVI